MVKVYLEHLMAEGKSEQTIKTYQLQLTKFFDWMKAQGGSDNPKEITSIDAVEYRNSLQGAGKKPTTVNTALASIEAFCKWMQDEGYIGHNPLAKVKRVDQVQEPPKWLTKNEKYRVIRVAMREKSKRNTVIIFTLLFAGLRVSELVSLKPDDVSLSERKGTIVVRAGKGNKRRVVPIPKDLRDCLGEYLTGEHATGTWLFGSQRGEQLTVKGVQHLCTAIGKKANVEGLTPHVLRHTYCHDLVSKGVNIGWVAQVAGHAKVDTTMIYTQPGEEELQDMVEKLSFT